LNFDSFKTFTYFQGLQLKGGEVKNHWWK
jgi:hypothetical protein